MTAIPPLLDHLIYAAADLDAAVALIEECTGVRAFPGGRHPAWGTRNAIIPLAPTSYLEVMGPDPERPAATRPSLFDFASLAAPRLVAWAAKGENLGQLTARAREVGVDLGEATPGQRLRPDGTTVSWHLTDPTKPRADGVIPFFIDWASGTHPGTAGPAQLRLLDFHAEHPEPDEILAQLRALGVDFDVRWGAAVALSATLQTPRGVLTLT